MRLMTTTAIIAMLALSAVEAAAGTPPNSELSASSATLKETLLPTDVPQVVERAAQLLETRFVFPEIGRRYAQGLRANLKAGAYDAVSAADLPRRLTTELQAIAPDTHLHVFAEVTGLEATPASANAAGPRRGRRPPPIAEAKWLEPGVAYISFRVFSGTPEEVAAVRAFMEEHLDAKTLIIDAREHHGGEVAEMDVILPYLFARRTELVTMDVSKAEAERSPEQEPSMHPAAGPPGISRVVHVVEPHPTEHRLFSAQVFYLTSHNTVSAGEHLALALKRTKRAVIVGEKTAGANHFGGPEPVGMGLMLWLPVGRTLDPDTGKDWEGVGIQPDVAVHANQALEVALRLSRDEK